MLCETCQISYGFSATERRGLIVMVIFVVLALIGCYAGVLWYAVRTRSISKPNHRDNLDNTQRNQAYDPHDETMSDLHRDSIPITPRV